LGAKKRSMRTEPPNPSLNRSADGEPLSLNVQHHSKRSRSLLLSFGAVLLALLAGAWLLLNNPTEITLNFTQAQLQEQLDPRFPAKKCVLAACVELMSPRLLLTDGSDRLGIETSFVATLGTRTMPGTAKFSGRPTYEQGSGNFYLQDVQVTEFQMTGNAPDFNEAMQVRGSGIVAAIMNRFPLYSVQSHPKYGAIAKLALKRVAVVNGQLQVVFVNPLLSSGR
jgi:hypothetical protein